MTELPEHADQVVPAPIKALRGVFAGIGQLLIAADLLREEAADESTDDQYDVFKEWAGPPPSSSRAETGAAEVPSTEAPTASASSAAPRRAKRDDSKRPTVTPPAKRARAGAVGEGSAARRKARKAPGTKDDDRS